MKESILFLCTGNSCRSQMAEGWAKKLIGGKYDIYSAGIETHGLNPNAVKVMEEAGVDITNQKSQNISEFNSKIIDYVITVCSHADDNCPIFPAKTKVVHYGFDDPPKLAKDAKSEDEKLDAFRRVRDEIKQFVLDIESHL